MKLALLVLAITACDTPTPRLRLVLAGPPSQACPSIDCQEVKLSCNAAMGIRIIDPDTGTVHLDQCKQVSTNGNRNMCALASIDLDGKPLPVIDLEVQVAVYPLSAVPLDTQTDPMRPVLMCPPNVAYNVTTGFPVEQSPTPALGGRAYYHPGDSAVVVTLGCTDLEAINNSCAVSDLLAVTATVVDFDTRYPVMGGSPSLADRLRISVGEPHESNGTFVLDPGDLHELKRSVDGPIPRWGDDLAIQLDRYACIEVFETVGQSTAALRCAALTTGNPLELIGARMEKDKLAAILLGALQLTAFPDEGLTVGLVVDDAGDPVAGAVVSATGAGTVKYLSSSLTGFASGGTSSNGIFVSRDALFGTEFSSNGASGIGGLVLGRVTIVILNVGGSAS